MDKGGGDVVETIYNSIYSGLYLPCLRAISLPAWQRKWPFARKEIQEDKTTCISFVTRISKVVMVQDGPLLQGQESEQMWCSPAESGFFFSSFCMLIGRFVCGVLFTSIIFSRYTCSDYYETRVNSNSFLSFPSHKLRITSDNTEQQHSWNNSWDFITAFVIYRTFERLMIRACNSIARQLSDCYCDCPLNAVGHFSQPPGWIVRRNNDLNFALLFFLSSYPMDRCI